MSQQHSPAAFFFRVLPFLQSSYAPCNSIHAHSDQIVSVYLRIFLTEPAVMVCRSTLSADIDLLHPDAAAEAQVSISSTRNRFSCS